MGMGGDGMTGMTVQDLDELIAIDFGREALRMEMGNGLVLWYNNSGYLHHIVIEGPNNEESIGSSLLICEASKVNWLFDAMGGIVNVLGIV